MSLCGFDQHDDAVCLCGCHRNIRHGACGAWRACTHSCRTAPKSWSGSMRGRRRRSPSTGATATPTWAPRESCTAWVRGEGDACGYSEKHNVWSTFHRNSDSAWKRKHQSYRKQARVTVFPRIGTRHDIRTMFTITYMTCHPPFPVYRKWGWSWMQKRRWCGRSRKQPTACVRRTIQPNRLWRWFSVQSDRLTFKHATHFWERLKTKAFREMLLSFHHNILFCCIFKDFLSV